MRTALLTVLLLAAATGEDRVAAYFAAFNQGEEAMVAFAAAHMPQARIAMYRQMKSALGTLALGAVTSDAPNVIRAKARAANGENLEFIFTIGPDRIASIAVENVGAGEAGPVDPAQIDRVARELDTLAQYGMTGAVRVVHDGKILLDKQYGHGAESVFDVGSLVKDFTRASIHRLTNEKKLTPGDTLGKFFPSLPADKAKITISQLLDHSSGLPLALGPDAVSVTKEQFLAQLASAKLGQPEYSNPGFSALAAVIEAVTGQSYEAYVKKTIFEPLGMKDTGYVLVQWPAHRRAHATADGVDEGNTFDDPHLPDGNSWSLRGNGGMLSTLADMQRFYEAAGAGKVPGLEGRGSGVEVGGNFTHYFLHHNESRDKLRILIATTDAAFPAIPLDRRIWALLRGANVDAPPAPVARAVKSATYGNFRLTPVDRVVIVTPLDQNAINALHGLNETPALAKTFNEKSAAVARDHVPASAIAKLGAIERVEVIGSFPPPPRPARGAVILGPMHIMHTDVHIVHTNGESRLRLFWTENGLRKAQFSEGAGGMRFVPVANDAFAHYDLKADAVTRLTIRDGKVTLSRE